MKDDIDEKAYNPFLVNRTLSYFQDTIAYANIMNQYNQTKKKILEMDQT
jgi:hypothetical protein